VERVHQEFGWTSQLSSVMNLVLEEEATIWCYCAALQERTCETYPHKWASIQMKMGDPSSVHELGGNAGNIERVIDFHSDALHVYIIPKPPVDCASLQMHIGVALSGGLLGGRANEHGARPCPPLRGTALTPQAKPLNPRSCSTILDQSLRSKS
jgi:hypothetical protein